MFTRKIVKGYKATNADMTCLGHQFQLNKRSSISIFQRIVPCHIGFHFCHQLSDVFQFYSDPDILVFEVEAYGSVKSERIKSCARHITLVKEVSNEQLFQLMERLTFTSGGDGESHDIARILAYRGYRLDDLMYHNSPQVRLAVASHKHGLDHLQYDVDWRVRRTVAKQGYALYHLQYDVDWRVRRTVAKQGYALDRLKDDPCEWVREAVATQGYALEQLKDDPNIWVRVAAGGRSNRYF